MSQPRVVFDKDQPSESPEAPAECLLRLDRTYHVRAAVFLDSEKDAPKCIKAWANAPGCTIVRCSWDWASQWFNGGPKMDLPFVIKPEPQ